MELMRKRVLPSLLEYMLIMRLAFEFPLAFGRMTTPIHHISKVQMRI